LIYDEVGVLLRDNSIGKFGYGELYCKPWKDETEASGDKGSESNEIHMREVSLVKDLGPLIHWLVREHIHEILSDLNSGLTPRGWGEFLQDGRISWQTTDTSLMGKIRDDSNHVVIKAVTYVSMASVPHGRSHAECGETSFKCVDLNIVHRPIWVVTNPSSSVIICDVGSVVTWLKNGHLVLCTKGGDSVFFVVSDIASSVWGIWSELAPVV